MAKSNTDRIKNYTARLVERGDDGKYRLVTELLWGDLVHIEKKRPGDGDEYTRVRARGMNGLVKSEELGGPSLLEFYFIDVGQGDGVLIRTPDDRHILIDGGWIRSKQPTNRNAADFVDWKFKRDYQRDAITLDAIVASHCDADHYGGLWDLINPDEVDELDIHQVPEVKTFYHAGIGWWTNGEEGNRGLGAGDDGWISQLLSNRKSLTAELNGLRPQGQWGQFLSCVADLKCDVQFLGRDPKNEYMPGYSPDDGEVSIRVLAPLHEKRDGKRSMEFLQRDNSKTTNGHSILLRVDYGRTRTLLTGDLNAASQRRILEAYTGQRQELAADVTKGCHHGSDDVSYEFLSAINAACTVISSGDNESHAHPRPTIVAASAQTGFTRIAEDRLVTPLVYSTEISRSYKLAKAARIDGEDVQIPADQATVTFTARGEKPKKLDQTHLVTGVVYGLVNVRTDGNTILCATLNEVEREWEIETFESRF